MASSNRPLLTTAAVWFGAFLLFTLPTASVLVYSVELLAGAAGAASLLTGTAANALHFAAVIVGAQVASDIAAVRLHGFAYLHQGRRGLRLARHLLHVLVALATLLVVGSLLVAITQWSLDTGNTVYLVFIGAVVLALCWVALRTVRAFRQGLHEPIGTDGDWLAATSKK
ncbi:hypothetical protein [Haladaptatus sp. ZSTT2]|uniref:hypothetical protein n=1 Tax=Haladaptatus sp. ZSTT2 TaxID=3120515 RepID=UPI00300F711F